MKDFQVIRPKAGEDASNGAQTLEYKLFGPGGDSRAVEGNAAVEQAFTMILLTTPGSDYFDSDMGAGIRTFINQTVSAENVQTRKAEITAAIIKAEEQILISQGGLDLPSSERLQRVDIRSLEYDFSSQTWSIEIYLLMDDGNVGRVALEV